MTCTNCSKQVCQNKGPSISQTDVDTAYMLEQTSALRAAFGLPMHSGEAANHAHHKEEWRNSFQNYQVAIAEYSFQEIAESIAQNAINLCSYLLDAGKTMHLHFEAQMKDIFMMGVLHDINVRAAFDIIFQSQMSMLVDYDDIKATCQHYRNTDKIIDFIHSSETLFTCINAKTGDLLQPVNFKAPDWSDHERWSYSSKVA